MTIPYSVALIPFGLILLGWFIFSVVCVVKMMRFGFLSRVAVTSTFIYMAFSAIVLVIAIANLRTVDWSTRYEVNTPTISVPGIGTNTSVLP